MHAIRPCVAVLALVLAGCNAAAPTQPSSSAAAPSSPATEVPTTQDETRRSANPREAAGAAQSSAGASSAQRQGATPASPIQSGFDQLSGRLTLLQEQVLQLRADSQRLVEQNQMLLNRLQVLSTSSATAGAASAASAESADMATGGASEQLDAAIGQLMQMLNQMEMPAGEGGQFAVVTTYTRQGAWILLRYDRFTGETWLADAGRWQPLSDVDYLNMSSYRVLVHRADQDAKGYVAVRFDEQSGMSWWLNGDRWQEYEQ